MKRYVLIASRKAKELSQSEVAAALEISQRAYSMIELNQINPSWQVTQRLEKYFGKPASELLGVDYGIQKTLAQ